MKNKVHYKKEPTIEICYQVVITICDLQLAQVQSLASLITKIQWECSVQVVFR